MPTPTPGVTITFTLTDEANVPVQGKVVFTLCGFGNQIPRITGTSVLAKLVYEADANSSGQGSAVLWGNYQITPGTFYSIAVYPGNNAHNVTSVSEYLLLSAGTFDLSTLVPINPSSFNPTPAPAPGGGKPGGDTNDVQINVNGDFYGDGGFTYVPSTKAVSVAGSVFVGPLDSSFSNFGGGAPAYFGCAQADTTNRFGTVNSGIFATLSVICQDDFTVNPTNAPTAANFQTWTTNTSTVTQNAIVFPSIINGIVASAHHLGTGDLAGTNNGPVGAFISATNETAAHVTAVTGTVIDIGNSGGGTIDTATSIWIPSIGDPGSTITTARGLYIAPQVGGAAATYAIYVDGATQSYFGGDIIVPAAITNSGAVFITPSTITFAAPSVGAQGATGATSYTYTVNALRSGVVIAQSAPATITNGNATLSGSNFNTVSWSAVPQADHYVVNNGYLASTPTTALMLNDTGTFTAYALSSQNGYLYTPNGALVGSLPSAMEALSSGILYDSYAVPGTLVVASADAIPAQAWASAGIVSSIYDNTQTNTVMGVNVGVEAAQPGVWTVGYYGEVYASNTTGSSSVFGFYPYVGGGINNGDAAEVTGIATQSLNYGTGTVALATNLHAYGIYNGAGGTVTEADGVLIEDCSGVGASSYALHVKNQTNATLGSASWAIKVDGGQSEFNGLLSVKNPNTATSPSNQFNSPSLALTGSVWDGSLSSAVPNQFSFDMTNIGNATPNQAAAILTLNHNNSNIPSYFTLGPDIFRFTSAGENVFGSVGAIDIAILAEQSNGTVFTLSAAANAVGNLTTYTGLISVVIPQAGAYITIAGFTNSGNNGRFIVQSGGTNTVTVYNSGGVAESHAATLTFDSQPWTNGTISSLGFGQNVSFPISGTNHSVTMGSQAEPLAIPFVVGMAGNATDAGYMRIVNDGATGNHGLEIGGIVDGTGASPVKIQVGQFSGLTQVNFLTQISTPQVNLPAATKASLKVNVSSAALKAMPGTPFSLLAAPGADKLIVVDDVVLQYRFNTTAYTIGNADNSFNTFYHGFSGNPFGTYAATTGLMDQTSNQIVWLSWQQSATMAQTGCVNLGVDLALAGTTPSLTLGDGTLEVILTYTIVDVS